MAIILLQFYNIENHVINMIIQKLLYKELNKLTRSIKIYESCIAPFLGIHLQCSKHINTYNNTHIILILCL